MKQEIEVKKFKRLIKDMHRGFPRWQYREIVEQVVITEEMRKQLIDSKILLKENCHSDSSNYTVYMLGPNALPLVSAWATEELTESIKRLTWAVIIMTGISLVILIIQSLRMYGVI